MPHIKNALIRYRIIDKCLRNKYNPFPSKEDLRIACEESLFGSSDGSHICDSTIEKDMFAMKMEHDAPIRYSKKDRGYYYEDPEFTINDIPLTNDDLEAISFAAKTLSQFRDVKMFSQFGSAIDKIVDRVTIGPREDDEQYIQFESTYRDGGSEFLADLFGAIKSMVWVRFEYARYQTEELEKREVLPLLLKQYRNRWYLISWDRMRDDFRTFGLDRIEDLEITSEKGERPSGFDPDNFFKHSIGITNDNSPPLEVILDASELASKYLDSLPLHISQKIVERREKGYRFKLTVKITEELIREIMSYGGAVKVIEPASLKAEIELRAKRILD